VGGSNSSRGLVVMVARESDSHSANQCIRSLSGLQTHSFSEYLHFRYQLVFKDILNIFGEKCFRNKLQTLTLTCRRVLVLCGAKNINNNQWFSSVPIADTLTHTFR